MPVDAGKAITTHRDFVQGETLALSLTLGEGKPSGVVSEAKLLDEAVVIGVAKAA